MVWFNALRIDGPIFNANTVQLVEITTKLNKMKTWCFPWLKDTMNVITYLVFIILSILSVWLLCVLKRHLPDLVMLNMSSTNLTFLQHCFQ